MREQLRLAGDSLVDATSDGAVEPAAAALADDALRLARLRQDSSSHRYYESAATAGAASAEYFESASTGAAQDHVDSGASSDSSDSDMDVRRGRYASAVGHALAAMFMAPPPTAAASPTAVVPERAAVFRLPAPMLAARRQAGEYFGGSDSDDDDDDDGGGEGEGSGDGSQGSAGDDAGDDAADDVDGGNVARQAPVSGEATAVPQPSAAVAVRQEQVLLELAGNALWKK